MARMSKKHHYINRWWKDFVARHGEPSAVLHGPDAMIRGYFVTARTTCAERDEYKNLRSVMSDMAYNRPHPCVNRVKLKQFYESEEVENAVKYWASRWATEIVAHTPCPPPVNLVRLFPARRLKLPRPKLRSFDRQLDPFEWNGSSIELWAIFDQPATPFQWAVFASWRDAYRAWIVWSRR